MNIRKATPIFIVDAITPASLAFWEATGWKKQVEVPHGDGVGFVILEGDGREVMLQTRASVREDLKGVDFDPACAFYCDVVDLKAAREACRKAGARVIIEERETFYGAKETWVVEPGGVFVGYAEMKKA